MNVCTEQTINTAVFICSMPVIALRVNTSIGNIKVKLHRQLDEDVVVGEELALELSELSMSQLRRFQNLGELTDIEECIPNILRAVQATGDDHPCKAAYLSNLAVMLGTRFKHLGELTDLEEGLSNSQRAVGLTDDGHPDKALYLSNLAVRLVARFDRLGELTDLEECVSNSQRAVELTDDGHPDKATRLSNLAMMQGRRFKCLGDLTDLGESISNSQRAVELTNDGHPDKASYLSNFALSLRARFEHLGELTDLEESVSNSQRAVELTDDGHSDKAARLSNLAVMLGHRFEHHGELMDLKESISTSQQAVELTNDGHRDKASYLSHLAVRLGVHFEHLGELADLEESVSNSQRAVELTDDGHPDKAAYLSNLAVMLGTRFKRLGELTDLEESISNSRQAVELTDDGHSNKAQYLSNLAIRLVARFERLGKLTDLEESVSNSQRAVELTDDGHPDKAKRLSNLASTLGVRFERHGELMDLKESVSTSQQAVGLINDGHPDKAVYLSNLAVILGAYFEHLGGLTDLEESVSNSQRAVELTDDKHPDKATYLSNLAVMLGHSFKCLKKLTDLEESLSNSQRAIELTDNGHRDKAQHLSNFALSLRARFEHLGELTDLEHCISNIHKAVQLTNDGHPDKAKYLLQLSDNLLLRFKCLGHHADLVASLSSCKAAAQSKTAYPRVRLHSAQKWADLSCDHGDVASALEGYCIALEVLPQVVWLGLSTPSRQHLLSQEKTEHLSCLAASCAIQQGFLKVAVELLDLGRSVFWQQAALLRAGMEKLKQIEPELANQLERVGHKLDTNTFSGSLLHHEGQDVKLNGMKHVGEEHRHLVYEWEGLLEKVRQLPDFQHFLQPTPFNEIQCVATGGHVIIINVSQLSVDALIFDDSHPILHVSLPDIDHHKIYKLATDMVLQRPVSTSATQLQRHTTRYLKPALRAIWDDILSPIFHKIHIPIDGTLDASQHHIWWYPTGPLTFIPIHAAGPGGVDIDVSHVAISSYTTTLSSLLLQQKTRHAVKGRQKLLALSQSHTPGQEHLLLASEEINSVINVACSAGWLMEDIVNLSGPDATVDRVSGALDLCAWVHFACHGMQLQTLGMNSAFALHDGGLELNQIALKKLSGQFAFLSACHTAAGLQALPGEAMHLAGGLQFAGFPSVIATMWGIRDEDALIVACYTYKYLFRNGVQGCNPIEAATALNSAVLHLRKDPKVTVDRWAPFIHFGI